jgi:hypothetical protein
MPSKVMQTNPSPLTTNISDDPVTGMRLRKQTCQAFPSVCRQSRQILRSGFSEQCASKMCFPFAEKLHGVDMSSR